MKGVDRNRVRLSFHAHAEEYDSRACVQRRVVERLAGLIEGDGRVPRRLLDVGCGTGLLLARLFPFLEESHVVGVDLAFGMCRAARDRGEGGGCFAVGDAVALPFADAQFDLVVSSSVFQWLDSLAGAFAEAFRLLPPGGTFRFALFGGRTLFELRQAYRRAFAAVRGGEEGRTMAFFERDEVDRVLAGAGFTATTVWSELETESYPDVPELLRAIRGVGAGNSAPPAARGLGERRVMLTMMEIYRRDFGVNGAIPATYEVIYGAGRKGG
jgi:malonyl-CoA O-methyltransferase